MSSVLSSSLPLLIDRISPTTRVPFWRTTTSTLGAARAGDAASAAATSAASPRAVDARGELSSRRRSRAGR